jgi:uncharacterized protein (TIGR02145 family)
MEIIKLTDGNLEEQIILFQDRIETISEYISETEDNTVKHVLISQRDNYREALSLLYDEKKSRLMEISLQFHSKQVLSVPNESEAFEFVEIGNHFWMISNLNVSQFNNGDSIKEAKSNEEWIKAGKDSEPAWCYYDNDPSNCVFGKLYNLYAVSDSRGIAPHGWHVAQHNEEWRELAKNPSKKIKSNSGWVDNRNGTNETGFSCLPGGYRNSDGTFSSLGTCAAWWPMGIPDKLFNINPHWFILSDRDNLDWFAVAPSNGYSVRCLKDMRKITNPKSSR